MSSKILKNSIFLYIRLVVSVFLSFFTTRLLLKNLGVESYGVYTIVGGVIAMLQMFNGTLVSATMRFIAVSCGKKDVEETKRIFVIVQWIHWGLAALVFFVLEICFFFCWKQLFNIPDQCQFGAHFLFQAMTVMSLATILTVPFDSLMVAHENLDFYAMIRLVDSFAKMFAAILLSYIATWKLEFFGLILLISTLLMCGSKVWFCRRFEECHDLCWTLPSFQKIRPIMLFSGWTAFATFFNVVGTRGVSVLLNKFFGVLVNSAEGVASMLYGELSILATTVLQAINPVIMKAEGSGDHDRALKLTFSASRCSTYIFILLTLPVICQTETVFHLWLGKIPEYAVIFCQINLFRLIFFQLRFPVCTLIEAVGKNMQMSLWTGCCFGATFLISWVLLSYGCNPVLPFIIAAASEFVLMLGILLSAWKITTFPIWSFISKILFPCLGFFALGYLIMKLPVWNFGSQWLRILISAAVGEISIVLLIFFFGLNKEEKTGLCTYAERLLPQKFKKLTGRS